MNENDYKKIVKILNEERHVNLPCPRCNNKHFTLVNGYFTHTLQSTQNELKIGGTTIPTVITVCSNCGFISQHAVGVLGLIPDNQETSEDEKDK
jgi:hypothetical protein